ncbi:hypothetical protein L1049_020250 [Liquidambar formosana]|uniref:Uncharacterized protein n=1 Tax=Liquidambar formosana TaxID=63359 RepID=A0AAP0X5V5_LIQFO
MGSEDKKNKYPAVTPQLVDSVQCELGYRVEYHSNIKDLKDQLEKLRDVRDRVERSIEAAKRNADEILPHVEKWLEGVNEIIKEAEEKFPDDEERANGLFPNLKSRYQLSKKAKETTT